MSVPPFDPSKETPFSQFLYVIKTYFFRLLGLNVLFLICCIPVVTIPAALCGLHAVVQRYYRKIYSTAVIRDFFAEFKSDFLKRSGLVWLVLAILAVILVLLRTFANTIILLVVSALVVLATLLLLTWFVPQLVLLNLDAVQALKNALILTMIETKTNFILMVLHAIVLTAMVCLLPMSGFALVFVPVLHTLLVTALVMPVFKKFLIHDDQTNDTVADA